MKIAVILLAIVDLLSFILFMPVVLLYALCCRLLRCVSKKDDTGSILHISGGSSSQDVLNKFGSMDFFFDYDGKAAIGPFSREIIFWFPSKNTLVFNFNNGWSIYEQRKALGLLPLFGLCLFFLRAIWLVYNHKCLAVRGWDPYYSGFFAWALSLVFAIPFCVSIHSDYDKRHKLDPKLGAPKIMGYRKPAKYLERFVLSNSCMVMPIRESLAKEAIVNGAHPETIRVIPHGIDMTPFRRPQIVDIRAQFAIDRNKKIVSFVGRLSKENYVDEVVALGEKLSAKRDDFVIVMAGGGNEEERLQKIISSDRQLGSSVKLLGFQPRKICLDLRRASAVSLALMAGFSLIEACAAGQPVVAYDIEWHNELVKSGETGFLVEEHDIDGLVESVSFLIDHQDESYRMGKNAQDLAFDRHDINKTSAIKRRYYEELLSFCRVAV